MENKKETDAGFWLVAAILVVFAIMLAATTIKLSEWVDIKSVVPSNGANIP